MRQKRNNDTVLRKPSDVTTKNYLQRNESDSRKKRTILLSNQCINVKDALE